MDFKNARELIKLCDENQWKISDVMKQRECDLGETTIDQVQYRMKRALDIMKESATAPLRSPGKSIGGLIGGEAKKLNVHHNKGKNICGTVLGSA